MHGGARTIGRVALCALIVCAVTLTAPGCGRTKPTKSEAIERYGEKLREVVSTDVPDGQRKTQMLMVVDRLEAVHLRFSQETSSFIERYRKLNADYDATRPAFDQLFSDYNAKRIKARQEALELHFQLASLAAADEWRAIAKAEVKLYEKSNAARAAAETTK